MIYPLVLIGELYILFLLSKILLNEIYRFLYLILKSKKAAIGIIALLFVPGTFVHELSHLVMCLILFVPFGKINLTPEIEGNGVKLGSLPIGKTDPLRHLLIGAAPFLFGTVLILLLVHAVVYGLIPKNLPFEAAAIYGIFVIGNTMFSSKKDMDGSRALLLLFVSIFLILYLLGFRITSFSVEKILIPSLIEVIKRACTYTVIPIALDLGMITFFKITR